MTTVPAFEFYAGDAQCIADAVRTDKWDSLRNGEITPHMALFPADATASQVDLIEETISVATGNEPVRFSRHDAVLVDVEEGGASVGIMPSDWVRSLAELNDHQRGNLAAAFRVAYKNVYEVCPDESWVKAWEHSLRELVLVCKGARERTDPVLEVFLPDW